jgi:hypothetical protein
MPADAASDLAERFALIIEALCDAVARRVGRGTLLGGLAGPLIILIRARLCRLKARFIRLATSSAEPVQSSRITPPRPATAPRQKLSDPLSALRRFAALLRLVPETAPLAAQLRHLLADPEMKALLKAVPRLGSTLRPLCRMLGIRPAQPAPPPGRAAPTRKRPGDPLSPRLPPPILLQTPA